MSTTPHPLSRADRPLRIGLLIVATAKYTRFVAPLLESARKHFMVGEQVTAYVFTDRPEELPIEAVALPVEHRAWPYATLLRYHHIARYRERLLGEEFVFQVDADMRFEGPVGREILPDNPSGLVGVEHPGFCWRPNRWQRWARAVGLPVRRGRGLRGSYETDERSLAWIGAHEGETYFAGGFAGGEFAPYLDMAASIRGRIDRDLEKGVIAVWHDESHLNRHFIFYPPKRLDPSYCFPESSKLPFRRRLVALDKQHSEMRAPQLPGAAGERMCLFVSAFLQRPEFVRWQYAALKRHVRGPWKLIVYHNLRLDGQKADSGGLLALGAELGFECREVRLDRRLEANAGRKIYRRRLFSRRLKGHSAWANAYVVSWIWRDLSERGELAGPVCLQDADVFFARDFEPAAFLAQHDLAYIPQYAPDHTYIWPGFAWFAGWRIPQLGELEWWLQGAGGRMFDSGAKSHFFLKRHPELRTILLRPRRLAEAAGDIIDAPEQFMGPESDEPLAYHFRCGSGWDRASIEICRRKSALILERVAWRDEVADHPIF